jgi:hypothetical protein
VRPTLVPVLGNVMSVALNLGGNSVVGVAAIVVARDGDNYCWMIYADLVTKPA